MNVVFISLSSSHLGHMQYLKEEENLIKTILLDTVNMSEIINTFTIFMIEFMKIDFHFGNIKVGA